jgi:DNA-binding protein HU-beta
LPPPGDTSGHAGLLTTTERGITMAARTKTKAELVSAMAEKAGLTQVTAADALDAFIAVVTSALRDGEAVALPDLGQFSVSDRAAREGRNPATGERIQIPASKAAKFAAAAKLKRVLNS